MADFYNEQDGPDEWAPDPIVAQVYKDRKAHAKHAANWRQEAREAFEYLAGEQWDSEDKARLEEQARPIVVFNRVAPIIDAVTGYEINNSQEVRYRPRSMSDNAQAEVYNEAARWVMQGCDGASEEADCYGDATVCGMGWTEWRVDYEEEPDGKLFKERVSPLQMRWDPEARKVNLVDKNWVSREKRWLIAEIRERWPDKADEITWTPTYTEDDEWLDEHDASRAWQYEQDQQWADNVGRDNKALVIQYQWREREDYYRLVDPTTGQVVAFDTERFEQLRESLDAAGVEYVKQKRYRYQQAFVCGKVLLETGPAPVDDRFSFDCVTAKREEQHGIWYGLHRAMKDPQRWANAFFSTAMHTMMANAKGGLIIEEGAVSDIRDLQDNWARPEGIVTVNDGALSGGQLQERSFASYPPGLDKLMSFAIASIRDCTGINLELLGMADRDQPNILEHERKKAALTILAPLTANLHRYRVESGRTLLSFMREYIPNGTLVRIAERPVTFQRDKDTIKYDVVVDTAPSSPNLKSEVWTTLSQLVPALVKAGVPVPPALLRFSPLPESVAEEWIEYMQQGQQAQIPEEVQKQLEQLSEEAKRLNEENQQLKAKREEAMAKLQQDDRQHAAEMQRELERTVLEKYKIEVEALTREKVTDRDRLVKLLEIEAKYDTDMAKIEGDLEKENRKADGQAAIKGAKNVVQLSAPRTRALPGNVDDRINALERSMEEQRQEAEQRRRIVYQFLASRGGEVAGVVQQLRAAESGGP